MKILARTALVAVAAAVLAGCGKSPTDPANAVPRVAPPVAQHVDNPGQTPMKDP